MCDLETAFAGYIGIDLIVNKLYKEGFFLLFQIAYEMKYCLMRKVQYGSFSSILFMIVSPQGDNRSNRLSELFLYWTQYDSFFL